MIIRPMRLADIDAAMRLKDREGWNQTPWDWHLFLAHTPASCFVAAINNEIVGTVTALDYSHKIGWIAMLLVDPVFRGHGIARQLLTTCLNSLKSCRLIKLDATAAGAPLYEKLGFRQEQTIGSMTIDSLPKIDEMSEHQLVHLVQNDNQVQVISSFDNEIFGANRASLFESMMHEKSCRSWYLLRSHKMTGYAFSRKGQYYNRIGPIGANNSAKAIQLLTTALIRLTGQPVVVDLPNDKEHIFAYLADLGFEKKRSFERMCYRQSDCLGRSDKMFAICGPEHG